MDEYDLPACELPDAPRSEHDEAQELNAQRAGVLRAVARELRRLKA